MTGLRVTLDGWDEPNVFEAYGVCETPDGQPIYWNGWATPLFTREQAQVIADAVSRDPDVHTMQYDADADAWVYLVTEESRSPEDGLDEFTPLTTRTTDDSQPLYPIGAFCWSWQVAR